MGILSCFKVILPSKWTQNKIRPESPRDDKVTCSVYPWESLVSTSYSKISWNTVWALKQEEKFIIKPGGLSFCVGLKDGTFTIPTLPPRKLPPIKREEISSLKQPKTVKGKSKGTGSQMTIDQKLAKAKVRRQAAEDEKRERTLRKLKMAVPQ